MWRTWRGPTPSCTARRKPFWAMRAIRGWKKRSETVERRGHVRWQMAAKRRKVKAMAAGQLQGGDAGFGEGEGAGARLRRTSLPRRQAPLPPPQGALPGLGQEHRPTPPALRPGQSGARPTPPAHVNPGLHPLGAAKGEKKAGETDPDRPFHHAFSTQRQPAFLARDAHATRSSHLTALISASLVLCP